MFVIIIVIHTIIFYAIFPDRQINWFLRGVPKNTKAKRRKSTLRFKYLLINSFMSSD